MKNVYRVNPNEVFLKVYGENKTTYYVQSNFTAKYLKLFILQFITTLSSNI